MSRHVTPKKWLRGQRKLVTIEALQRPIYHLAPLHRGTARVARLCTDPLLTKASPHLSRGTRVDWGDAGALAGIFNLRPRVALPSPFGAGGTRNMFREAHWIARVACQLSEVSLVSSGMFRHYVTHVVELCGVPDSSRPRDRG